MAKSQSRNKRRPDNQHFKPAIGIGSTAYGPGFMSNTETTNLEGIHAGPSTKDDVEMMNAGPLPKNNASNSTPQPSNYTRLPPPEPSAAAPAPIASMQAIVPQPLGWLPVGSAASPGFVKEGSTPTPNWASGAMPAVNAHQYRFSPAGPQRRAYTAPQMNSIPNGAPTTTNATAQTHPPYMNPFSSGPPAMWHNRPSTAYIPSTLDVRDFQACSQIFEENISRLRDCIEILHADGSVVPSPLSDKLALAIHSASTMAGMCAKVHQEFLQMKYHERDMITHNAVLAYQINQLKQDRDAFEAEKRAFRERTEKSDNLNPLMERIENLRLQGVEGLGMLKSLLEIQAMDKHSPRPSAEPPETDIHSPKPSAEPLATDAPSSRLSAGPTATDIHSSRPFAGSLATDAPSSRPSAEFSATEAPSSRPLEGLAVTDAPSSRLSAGPTATDIHSSRPSAGSLATDAPSSRPSAESSATDVPFSRLSAEIPATDVHSPRPSVEFPATDASIGLPAIDAHSPKPSAGPTAIDVHSPKFSAGPPAMDVPSAKSPATEVPSSRPLEGPPAMDVHSSRPSVGPPTKRLRESGTVISTPPWRLMYGLNPEGILGKRTRSVGPKSYKEQHGHGNTDKSPASTADSITRKAKTRQTAVTRKRKRASTVSDPPEDSSDDSDLDYYGRPADYLNSIASKADQIKSSGDTSSKATGSVCADFTDEPCTSGADGSPPIYVGTEYSQSQIPDLSPEIRSVIESVESRSRGRNWWTSNSKANAWGTKVCAYAQIVSRSGVSMWNSGLGTDLACDHCTKARRACVHAAIINGEMKLIVKDPQPRLG
ncbi:hypothetical protein K440DRAFT_661637 [Wilcoxina mikolae CBS 423.85]|nr:hypothetical protein K440DRAFT_661637 [Wilcoxina mikolae CBS 423.85]